MKVDYDRVQAVAATVRRGIAAGAGKRGASLDEVALGVIMVLGEVLSVADPGGAARWLRREAERVEKAGLALREERRQ